MAEKKEVKIPEMLFFQEGPGVRNTQYTTSGVKLLNVANLVEGKVDLSTSDRYISEDVAYGKYNHFLCDEDDFIVASSGIKVDYIDKKMGFITKEMLPLCMNTSTIRFKVLDDSKLNIRYFMYFLKSNAFKKQLAKQITGSAQLNYGPSHLKQMTFPLIDIKSQNDLVKKLDYLIQIMDKKNESIRKYDDLIKARFVEMFGTREKWNDANWKITSIDEIIEKPKSGEWGQKDESGRGIGVIRTTNFSDRGAVYFNSITTRDIPREKLITKGIKNGDILIEKSGGSDKKPVGRVVLYTGESNKYLNNNFTAILRINNNTEVNNIFLFTFLYINYWQGGTKVFESKTTGIHNLNLKEFLNKTKIAIPDMLLQNQFATFVAQVDKSKFAVQKSLEKTQLLFDSLMQEYFG